MKNIFVIMIGAGLLLLCVTRALATDTTSLQYIYPAPAILNESQSSILNWSNQLFKIKGEIVPQDLTSPLSPINITLQTSENGVFVNAKCNLEQIDTTGNTLRCNTPTTRATLRKRTYQTGVTSYIFRMRHIGFISFPTTPEITTRVDFACDGHHNVATWTGTLGRRLRNKF